MSGFNNAFVPHYAPSDTPALRPREIQLPDSETLNWKAARMKAYIYVRQYIDTNWKKGDQFVYSDQPRILFDKKYFSRHASKTGKFVEKKLVGSAWYIYVEWDDKEYKPVGLGSNKVGMFDFYHFAFPKG